jgi:hypothetical protein
MLIVLAGILLVLAILGGIAVHPLLFALVVVAILMVVVPRRGTAPRRTTAL